MIHHVDDLVFIYLIFFRRKRCCEARISRVACENLSEAHIDKLFRESASVAMVHDKLMFHRYQSMEYIGLFVFLERTSQRGRCEITWKMVEGEDWHLTINWYTKNPPVHLNDLYTRSSDWFHFVNIIYFLVTPSVRSRKRCVHKNRFQLLEERIGIVLISCSCCGSKIKRTTQRTL